MATNDWKNLSEAQRNKFVKDAADEHASKELNAEEKEKKIDEYNERVRRFRDELNEEKVKILKKYGLHHKKEQKLLEKKKKRDENILKKHQEKLNRD